MNLGILYFADRAHGYGHHYRCLALANTARQTGHTVWTISNAVGSDIYIDGLSNLSAIGDVLKLHKFDWLIVDLEDPIPDWVCDIAHARNIKVANLNGLGWNTGTALVDFSWVQDTPETVILREAVMQTERKYSNYWFVFGGSADPLNLRMAFAQNLREQSAFLIQTDLAGKINTKELGPCQRVAFVHEDTILPYMASAEYACTHLGVTCWELAYIGVPNYIFSRTEGHLHFAQNLERLGLARAFPRVGLPDKAEMRAFLLDTPKFTVAFKNRPDGKGAERFIKALEDFSD